MANNNNNTSKLNQVDVSGLDLIDKKGLLDELTKRLKDEIRDSVLAAVEEAKSEIADIVGKSVPTATQDSTATTNNQPATPSTPSTSPENNKAKQSKVPRKSNNNSKDKEFDDLVKIQATTRATIDKLLEIQKKKDKITRNEVLKQSVYSQKGKSYAEDVDEMASEFHKYDNKELESAKKRLSDVQENVRFSTVGKEQDLLTKAAANLQKAFDEESKKRSTLLGKLSHAVDKTNVDAASIIVGLTESPMLGLIAKLAGDAIRKQKEKRQKKKAESLKVGDIKTALPRPNEPENPENKDVKFEDETLKKHLAGKDPDVVHSTLENLSKNGNISPEQHQNLKVELLPPNFEAAWEKNGIPPLPEQQQHSQQDNNQDSKNNRPNSGGRSQQQSSSGNQFIDNEFINNKFVNNTVTTDNNHQPEQQHQQQEPEESTVQSPEQQHKSAEIKNIDDYKDRRPEKVEESSLLLSPNLGTPIRDWEKYKKEVPKKEREDNSGRAFARLVDQNQLEIKEKEWAELQKKPKPADHDDELFGEWPVMPSGLEMLRKNKQQFDNPSKREKPEGWSDELGDWDEWQDKKRAPTGIKQIPFMQRTPEKRQAPVIEMPKRPEKVTSESREESQTNSSISPERNSASFTSILSGMRVSNEEENKKLSILTSKDEANPFIKLEKLGQEQLDELKKIGKLLDDQLDQSKLNSNASQRETKIGSGSEESSGIGLLGKHSGKGNTNNNNEKGGGVTNILKDVLLDVLGIKTGLGAIKSGFGTIKNIGSGIKSGFRTVKSGFGTIKNIGSKIKGVFSKGSKGVEAVEEGVEGASKVAGTLNKGVEGVEAVSGIAKTGEAAEGALKLGGIASKVPLVGKLTSGLSKIVPAFGKLAPVLKSIPYIVTAIDTAVGMFKSKEIGKKAGVEQSDDATGLQKAQFKTSMGLANAVGSGIGAVPELLGDKGRSEKITTGIVQASSKLNTFAAKFDMDYAVNHPDSWLTKYHRWHYGKEFSDELDKRLKEKAQKDTKPEQQQPTTPEKVAVATPSPIVNPVTPTQKPTELPALSPTMVTVKPDSPPITKPKSPEKTASSGNTNNNKKPEPEQQQPTSPQKTSSGKIPSNNNNNNNIPTATTPAKESNNNNNNNEDGKRTSNVDQMAKVAVEIEKETGYPSKVLMTQFALESGRGKAASGDYNYFGMTKGGSDKKLTWTKEVLDSEGLKKFKQKLSPEELQTITVDPNQKNLPQGKVRYKVQRYFASYNSLKEGALAYTNNIIKNPRYGPAYEEYKKTKNPEEFMKNIAKAGYATDPNYANSLVATSKSKDITDALAKAEKTENQSPVLAGATKPFSTSLTASAAQVNKSAKMVPTKSKETSQNNNNNQQQSKVIPISNKDATSSSLNPTIVPTVSNNNKIPTMITHKPIENSSGYKLATASTEKSDLARTATNGSNNTGNNTVFAPSTSNVSNNSTNVIEMKAGNSETTYQRLMNKNYVVT